MADTANGFEVIINTSGPRRSTVGGQGTDRAMKVYSKKYSRVVFGDDDPSVRATSEAREAMKNGSSPAGIRRGAEQHVAGRDCEIIPKRQLKPAPEGVAAGKTRIHLGRDDAPAIAKTGLVQGDLNDSLAIQQNGFYEESPVAGTSSSLHAYRRENIPTRYMGGPKPPSTISISQDDSLRLPESSQQESFARATDPQLATQAQESVVCGVTSAQQNHVKDHMRMASPPVRPPPKFRYDKIVVVGSELAPDQKFPVESERTEALRITAEKASRGDVANQIAAGTATATRLSDDSMHQLNGSSTTNASRSLFSPLSRRDATTAVEHILTGDADAASINPVRRTIRRIVPTELRRDSVQVGDMTLYSPMATFSTSTHAAYDQHQRGGLDRSYRPLVRPVTASDVGSRAVLSHQFIGGEPQNNRSISPQHASRRLGSSAKAYTHYTKTDVFGTDEAPRSTSVLRPIGKKTFAQTSQMPGILDENKEVVVKGRRPLRAASAYSRREEYLSPTLFDLISGAASPIIAPTGQRSDRLQRGRGELHPHLLMTSPPANDRAGKAAPRVESGSISDVLGSTAGVRAPSRSQAPRRMSSDFGRATFTIA